VFVAAPTPMDRIPLYARAGAVIPMWPSAPPSTDERPDTIELHLFPASDGETHVSFLQEDDGLTLDGPTRRTRLELTGSTLRTTSEGAFAGARFTVVNRSEPSATAGWR
jgi:alpha-glucosidase